MRRNVSVTLGAVLAFMLAGCSLSGELARSVGRGAASSESVSINSTVEAGPPAFHFESGTLELGDFNPDEIKDVLFNPCEEISAAEYAAIGFEKDQETWQVHGSYSCGLSRKDQLQPAFVVSGGTGSLEIVKQSPRVFAENVSDIVPGLYTYGTDHSEMNICFASVDTVRGQVGAMVSDWEEKIPFEELCVEAVSLIEALYSL